MNQFGLSYIHTWKYHKETPCVAILNKQKYYFFFLSFTKSENRRAEQVLPRGRGTIQVRRGRWCRKGVRR
jgi:hypothetical protein